MEKIDPFEVIIFLNGAFYDENIVDAIIEIQKEVLNKYNNFIFENAGKPDMDVYYYPLFRDVENEISKFFDGKINQRLNFCEDGKYYEISLIKGFSLAFISTKIGR